METPLISLKHATVSLINFGFFRLDGGAMFGSTPKNMWAKLTAPDDQNRILLAARALIVRMREESKEKERTFLIDIGCGTKWNEKLKGIYAIESYPEAYEAVSPTDIILTHLHFDHAGGVTKLASDGTTPVLTYPNATVWLQKANWERANNPGRRERASYLKENVEPLQDSSLELVEGTVEVTKGIFVHQINGHTRGQQWIEITDGEQAVFFPTDLMPTIHHVHPAFHMGYDLCAETVLREKEEFLQQAFEKNALVVFQHEPVTPLARISKDEKGEYIALPINSTLR